MRFYLFDIHYGELMPIAKSIRNVDILTACAVATLVGLLGLWSHLAFMNEIGEFRYFHGAYDEDTYTLGWLRGTLRSTRLLSGAGLNIVYLLAGMRPVGRGFAHIATAGCRLACPSRGTGVQV
jgi:hypothetical protein